MATESITTQVADRVAATITRSGLSKSAVAEKSGIPLSTFNRKLNGHADFSVREIAEVARVLGVLPSLLLPAEFRAVA